MRKTTILILILLLTTIVKANDTIQIHQNHYFIDFSNSLVVTNVDVSIVNATWTDTKTHVLLGETCSFLTPVDDIEIGTAYTIHLPSQNSDFVLYFTELPIIGITTNATIVDEPNVLAHFKMIEPNQDLIESYIGIQYRGGWSQTYPKKSMEIEFWENAFGIETADYALLGMVNDDDWNLQAMYNEPLRMRSKTNNALWRMINTLHYQDQEPEAINGIRMEYVELFINSEYRGLYCLGEKVNRKQLKIKKHNGIIRGELYKGKYWGDGASTFSALPPYSNNSLFWDGFEYKHPEEEIDWSKLYEFVDFVMNASNQDFLDDYKNRFNIDNLVDYYIFLNLLRATDNTGKNTYIAKYNANDKYFYVPWDLDGTFGTVWNGTKDNTTSDLLSNGFYDRLKHDCSADGFSEKLKNKWLALRSTVLTHDSLMSLFYANHNYLVANGVYDRESLTWEDYTYNSTDLGYMSNWITNRLAYLDDKFMEDCIPLLVEDNGFHNDLIHIYPNPTNDVVFIDSELHEFKIFVCNNLGQVVLQKLFNESDNTLFLGNLDAGTYFLKVEKDQRQEVHKIIVTN